MGENKRSKDSVKNLSNLHKDLRKLQKDVQKNVFGDYPIMTELPHVDMYHENSLLNIQFYLPNFKLSEIEVNSKNNILEVIAARKDNQKTNKNRRYLIQETRSSYARQIVLPDGTNSAKTSAIFRKNILTLTMPFKPKKLTPVALS